MDSIYDLFQAAEIKNLKLEIERLKKPEECPIPGREQEWKDFQWLFEISDDGEDDADTAKVKRQAKQRRPADDNDDSDNGNDTDHNSIDGQARLPPRPIKYPFVAPPLPFYTWQAISSSVALILTDSM